MSSTLFLLMAQFGGQAEIELAEIAEHYLGMKVKRALALAAVQKLPFPVHRLGTQKSPWMVSLIDLAAYIDERRAEAQSEWQRMNAA